MPHLLPAAASAIAAAAPAAASTAAATAAKVSVMTTLKSVAFNALTNLAISAALSVFTPTVGAAARTVEFVIDPDGPIPFAAGHIGVPGAMAHKDTFGPDLMYYGIPVILSGAGPITAIQSVKADDYPMAFDANGGATTEPYRQEFFFRSVLGHQPAPAALSLPNGLKGGGRQFSWSAAHKLSGKAAFLMVMAENSKGSAFPNGEVKPLVELLGLKGWDPTQDSTYPGGNGPCRLHDASTWVTLTCPILWGLKWALGLWEGPTLKGAPAHDSTTDHQVGGIGARLSGVDVPAFVAASNIAKANAWTVSAYPNTDDDKHQVLETFLQAGGAIYSQRAGKISCISRAAPRASLVTISAADTAGPLEIDTAASRIDRINTLRPRFWSPAHRWQMTAMDGEVTAQSYRDEDGGRTRSRGVDFPFVSNAKQTGQLAALQIANTREGIAGVIPLKPHLQRIRPGDAFTITEAGFVLNGLKCLCLNTDYDPATGVVRVSFVSETDAKYPFALGQNPTPPTPQVLTPVDPRFVSPPEAGDWTVTPRPPAPGGGQLPGFDLAGIVSNATATAIIVEYGLSAAGPWKQAYQGPPTVTNIPLDGLQPGVQYWIAIQYQRNQNYSARHIYGPYTSPQLIAGDLAPGAPTAVLAAQHTGLIAAEMLRGVLYRSYTDSLLNLNGQPVATLFQSLSDQVINDLGSFAGTLNLLGAKNQAGTGFIIAADQVFLPAAEVGGQVTSLRGLQLTTATNTQSIQQLFTLTDGFAESKTLLVVNDVISGIVNQNDGSIGSLLFQADVFGFADPNGGAPTYPLSYGVDNILRLTNTIVHGDLVVTGTLTNRALVKNTITGLAVADTTGVVTLTGTTAKQVQSVWIEVNGQNTPVKLLFNGLVLMLHNASGSFSATFEFRRASDNGPGVALRTRTVDATGDTYDAVSGSYVFTLNDVPGPGIWRYFVTARSSASNMTVQQITDPYMEAVEYRTNAA